MKEQINEKLFEYYKELFNAEWQGEKVWKQIRDKKLTIAPCFKGDLYDNSNVQLMVVGRAVNGWEHDFQNCIDAETTTKIALNQNFNFDDVTIKKDLFQLQNRIKNRISMKNQIYGD